VGKLSIEGDETVLRGNALIESNQGIIECGIEKHVQAVEKAFRAYAITEKIAEGDGAANGTET
jgi:flagellar biosynthesis/type III secretory pathway protein FliH